MRTVTTNRLAFKLTLGTNEGMNSVLGSHGEKTSEDFFPSLAVLQASPQNLTTVVNVYL